MKLTIKNYKTLRSTKIETNKGDIHYFRGTNESGKANILNAIRSVGANSNLKIEKNDKTKIKHVPIVEEISIEFSYQSNPEISNKISEEKKQIWNSKNLLYFNNYLKMLEKHQTDLISLKNNINYEIANSVDTDMKKSYAQPFKEFKTESKINFFTFSGKESLLHSFCLSTHSKSFSAIKLLSLIISIIVLNSLNL